MKKVILIALAVVMALGCVAAFADYDTEGTTATFSRAKSFVGQSFNDGNIGSPNYLGTPEQNVGNDIRFNWTATRAMTGVEATFVDLGDDNIAVQIKGNEAIVNDYKSHGANSTYLVTSFDLKINSIGTFAGITINATNAGIGSGSTELPTAGGKYLQNTGFGFTVIAANKVQIFVAGTAEANFDSYDFELPIDLTDGFHNYAWYVDYATLEATLVIDDVQIGKVVMSGTPGADGEIRDVDDQTLVETNDGFNVNGCNNDDSCTGNIMVAFAGSASDVVLDNVYYDFLEELDIPDEEFPSENPATGDSFAIVAVVAVAALALVVLKKKETI